MRGCLQRTMGRYCGNQRGVALIMTLFVLALVTVLVLEYHLDARIELDLAANYANDVQAYYLALAGIDLARALLLVDDRQSDGLNDVWAAVDMLGYVSPAQLPVAAKQLLELLPGARGGQAAPVRAESTARGGQEVEAGRCEAGCVHLRIVDEERKLPLNALGQSNAVNKMEWFLIFQSFFANLQTQIDPEEIVAALVDWIDVDDEPYPGQGGAEEAYYAGLAKPYKARNGPIRTPGELRMIKGFDTDTLRKLMRLDTAKGQPLTEADVGFDAVADVDIGNNDYVTPYVGQKAATTGVPPPSPAPSRPGQSSKKSAGSSSPGSGGGSENTATKVNICTANEEVLGALLAGLSGSLTGGATPDIESIKEACAEEKRDVKTVLKAIKAQDVSQMGKFVSVTSTYFRIESEGRVGDIRKRAVAVVQREQNDTRLLFYKVE